MASFRKRGDYWQFRIKHNGKELSKSGFRTKAEAKIAADKMEHELNIGVQVNKADQLFVEYYKQWIKTYKLGFYSKDTDNFYLNAVKLIEEYFPHHKLKDLTRDEYQAFLNDYSENNGNTRAKETVRKTHTKISASIRDAMAEGIIVHNPTHRITIRGKEGTKDTDKYLDEEEAKDLLETLTDRLIPTYTTRYMIILQLATGMRIGEIMGLQFKDFNFLHNYVDINKAWDYKETLDFVPTKNRETRVISVDKKTMKIMKEFYDFQLSQKIVDSKQRIFAVHGKIKDVNSANRTLERACKRIGIDKVTTHAMRHTHASILLLNGVSLAYISRRLGHKDISMTANTYSHVLKELEVKSEKESADMFFDMYN